jgi:Planctomycete cytochrome C/WD domain, G-beta repeat
MSNNTLISWHSRFRVTGVFLVCLVSLWPNRLAAQSMSSQSDDPSANQLVSYDAVQLVIRKHCASCHNEDQPRGDLVLTSFDKVMAGSSSGPVVVPGSVAESPLYTLAAHLDSPKMPPNKPRISQRELNLIERWINTGLKEEVNSSIAKLPMDSETIVSSDTKQQTVTSPLRRLSQATPILAVAAHPSDPVVAVAGFHQVVVLRTDTGKIEEQAIDVGQRDVSALRFSQDGKRLFIAAGIAGGSGTVMVLNWQEQKWLPNVGDELDTIASLDCNHDSSMLAIGTTSRVVKTLRVDSGEQLNAHRKHTDWVLSVAFSPDGLLLASGDRFGGIHVWESESGAEFAGLRGHSGGITGLSWSRDGNQLASSSLDGTVRVWDMHTLQSVERWVAHDKGALCISRDVEDRLVTGGRDGTVRKWGSDRSKPIWENRLSDEVLGLASLKGGLLATDAGGSVLLFNTMDAETTGIALALPIQKTKRVFTTNAPIAPKRTSIASQLALSDATIVNDSTSLSSIPTGFASDLEESRRALLSIEESLKQTYRTAEQLEESVARLKQIIALQEARRKQQEIREKQSK